VLLISSGGLRGLEVVGKLGGDSLWESEARDLVRV
jgi:hypothetical protein